jgi:ABC-type transporter lipoprotein component MlaA/pimeloyl-ACP methyl ester carboxylesterase
VARRRPEQEILGFAVLLLAVPTGCDSTVHRHDWSNYTGPGAQYFRQEELEFPHFEDPIEPANRFVSAVDYAGVKYVFRPIAWTYRYLTPPTLREHVAMLGKNLQYPGRAINNLLQAKWHGAWEETERFAVNTTVGLLGFFDPATEWGLHPHTEDFGQTLAAWGWRDSLYVYLPVFGPSTVRDAIGLAPDAYTDLAIFDWRITVAREFNLRSDEVEPLLRMVDSEYDAYEPARTIFELRREVDVTDFSWRREESGPTQTLDSIFLKARDPAFPERTSTRSADLPGGRALPFDVWLQDRPAPLVYVVPGMGGNRMGDQALGLAEMIFEGGSSVVTISNPANWEFIEHGSTADLPGYAPVDSLDLHRALTAVDRSLRADHPGRFTSRELVGLSLGGFQALYVAAREPQDAALDLVPFDAYVALDPPVDFEHAMHQLDRFYNAPLQFPASERQRRIDEIFGKVIYLADGDLAPDLELPFTQVEAEFLIGLAFRFELQSTILQTQERHDQGVLRTPRSWWRRAPAFREASEYSYLEYVYAFLLPYYAGREPRIGFDEAGARTLFADCDLRAIGTELAANPKVRVFANENDFLLRPEDITWLRERLGERAHFFPAGGHVGNLHREEIQDVITEGLAEASGVPRIVMPPRDPLRERAEVSRRRRTPLH